jgi:hypothetical protein
MTESKTMKRRKRLLQIRNDVRAVECLLLELKKQYEGQITVPSFNDGFGGLYRLQRLARKAP